MSFSDDEEKIAKLRIENKNLASSVDYYSKRSKRYSDERKILREEVSALKMLNADLLQQTSGLNDENILNLKAENTELKRKIFDLEDQIVQIQQVASVESFEKKIKNPKDAKVELQKKISDLEQKMVKDRDDFENEKKTFAKKFSDFSRKTAEEKKTVELKCIKLSQQISDFEKVIILEREKFEKKKTIEQRNVGIFKEIFGQRTNDEKEQKAKSEFKEEIDRLVRERDSYSSKIKELEDIVSMVVVTEQTTPESQIHKPRDDSVDSECTHRRRRRRYAEEKLVWKVKPVDEEKNDEKKEEKKGKKEEKNSNKSFVHESKANKNKVMKDTTLFLKKQGEDLILIQIYVEDIILGSTNPKFCKNFSKIMEALFEMSMMGERIFFLGLQVKQSSDGIFINQLKYIDDILKKFNMTESSVMKTPMATDTLMDADLSGKYVDPKTYCSMIGSLLYLTASRPDIMFATCFCARYQANPKEPHIIAVKRILRYLKGTLELGLWYPKDSGFDLTAYTDADYAGCKLDRKSTSGSCQFLGDKLVSWTSKKENCVSTSTDEAEYIAVASCCSQIL
ncbi:hypothetical protein L6452_09583 [Arctium lappa]|uniref:Uncharacterized protein n=1 Tax=Arctium lappa TaxID=4217 RepID=A0ACB9DKW1_ARCLA|nr:hypothetical protein L6452_09583 [Arctium lappa]